MRRFSLHRRGQIYYAQLRNQNTGKFMTPKSTGATDRDGALLVVARWLNEGIPTGRQRKLRSISDAFSADAAMNFLRFGSLTSEDAECILTILQERRLARGVVLTKPGSEPFLDFLHRFWTYDQSPYVADKLFHDHSISRRHCYDALLAVKGHWTPHFEGCLLGEVTRQRLKEFSILLREKKLASKTINNILQAGTVALRWAAKNDFIPSNPAEGLSKFSETPRKRGVLTPEEAGRLFSVPWDDERSRVANKAPKKSEEQVLKIRSRLENSKYSQIGAMAIQWEMQKLGIKPLPSWTIDRILKRHNVVREKEKYKPSGKRYPDVKEIFSDSIQQADLLGPRYIKNDGRFYSLNVIDLENYLSSIYPCRTKGDEDMARGLIHAWKNIGKPDFVQLDNELSFRGSNRYPRTLGLVIRMCLALRVQVIFIPVGEPWRNGTIEKFQDVFDKMFYRRQLFRNFEHLKQEARSFEKFRNKNHHCSALQGKTPLQYVSSENIYIRKLDHDVTLKKIDLSLEDSYVHLIRFIRSDCQLDVFGEKFKMPEKVKYEYVIATICTKIHALQVRLDKELIETYEYPIPIERIELNV